MMARVFDMMRPTIVVCMASLLMLLGLSSCSNDECDDYRTRLENTVWVYKRNSTNSVFASALYFGKYEVEEYELDSAYKRVRLVDSYKYSVNGGKLKIGIKECIMGEHYIDFDDDTYFSYDGKI